MFQHQGGGPQPPYNEHHQRRHAAPPPPPINTKQQQPTQQYSPSLRQGRFLSPTHAQQDPLSPTSQVRFEEEDDEENDDEERTPSFMFESGEWSSSSSSNDNSDDDDENQENSQTNAHSTILPTETQLTLLCLDYLRNLRRSYSQHPDDLINAEGLHPDYIALAAWSLSRAFIKPQKLTHGHAKVSTVVEQSSSNKGGGGGKSKKGREVEFQMYGGGGLDNTTLDDGCVGNDNMYRLLDDDDDNVYIGDEEDENNTMNDNGIFPLSERISLPTMEDITNEVLLRHPNEQQQPFGHEKKKKESNDSKEDEESDDEENEEPYYELNDAHSSNAHRFYLLNGLASEATSSTTTVLTSTGLTPKNTTPHQQHVNIHGNPLTITEIISAGLGSLRARSRIAAEKDIVRSDLFQQFVQAASAGGFFQEKRGDIEKRFKDVIPDDDVMTPAEKNRRSKLLYEEKYKKVVNKFQSKLAGKEAQLLLMPQQQTSSSPHHKHPYHGSSPSRMNSAYKILSASGNASVSSAGGGGGGGGYNTTITAVDSIMHAHDITERQRKRRERRVGRVKSQRRSQEVTFVTEEKLAKEEVHPSPATNGPPVQHQQLSKDMSSKLILSHQSDDDDNEQEDAQVVVAAAAPSPTAANTNNLPHYQEAEKCNAVGNSLMQQKQFQEALRSYTSALTIAPGGPNSHVYYSNRSAAYLSLNQNESSIRDSERAIVLQPEYSKAFARLGLAYYACGRYSDAVRAYETSLQIEPDNDWTINHLAMAKNKLVIEDGKDYNIEKRNSVDPPSEAEEEDKDEAEEEIWPTPFDDDGGEGSNDDNDNDDVQEEAEQQQLSEEEIAEQTRQATRYKDIGNEYMSKKEYQQALEQYNLAIEVSPSGPNSHVYYSNRAAAYCYLANYEAATNDCEMSIELKPTYEKAHARLGLSFFFRGEYENAIAAYERSLELDPNNKASLSYLRKAKARFAEEQMKEEEERRKLDEDRERNRKRMEFMNQQRQLKQQQQQQQQQQQHTAEDDYEYDTEEDEEEEDDEVGSLGDNTGITSTGLTSIVTNEEALNESFEVEAFNPFSTEDE